MTAARETAKDVFFRFTLQEDLEITGLSSGAVEFTVLHKETCPNCGPIMVKRGAWVPPEKLAEMLRKLSMFYLLVRAERRLACKGWTTPPPEEVGRS